MKLFGNKPGRHHSANRRSNRRSFKRILPVALAVILLATVAVGATIAFLREESAAVTNSFKAGNITYTLNLEPNAANANTKYTDTDVTMPTELTAQTSTDLSVTFTPDADPALTGYTFEGWYYDAGCAEAYTDISGKAITVNYGDENDSNGAPNKVEITLYAKWEPITYTVQYDGNNATGGSTVDSTHTYDAAQNLTANGYTRTGYKFLGWSTSATATTPEFTDGESVTNLADTQGAVVNLYAVWKQMDFTLSYDTQTSTVANPAGKTVTFEQPYGELATVSRTGYIFNGWALEQNGGTPITKDSIVSIAGNHTAYAQWTPIQYTVKYHGNGVADAMADSTHTYDVEKTLTANTYIRRGYTFTGWNTEADGSGTAYADKASVKNLADAQDAVFDLYAQWQANTYVVKYNANGGTGTMADQTFTYDVKNFLRTNTFEKTGYDFIGWATTPDGAVKFTDKAFVYNLTSDAEITLYAVWSAGSIVVSFETGYADFPADPPTKVVTFDHPYGDLPTPEIEGYKFLGWFTERESGTQITSESIVKINKSHTLYAHWQSPDIDLLLMFPGSGTNNFTTYAKHDYTFNEAITYTGQTWQGKWESFSIRLSNLVVGGTYQLKFDAAFSDRTCIRGYSDVAGNDNEDYPIGCKVDDESYFAPSGSEAQYTWVPTNSRKSTNDFVIEFVATKDTMFWLWELSKIRNPGETYLPDWKPGVENFEESYFDLVISDISLTLMPPDIEFENISAPKDNVVSFKKNSSTDTSVNFNLKGGSGRHEKANIPITDLIVGQTYTVNFDLTTNAHGGAGTYHFGIHIGKQPSTTNDADLGSTVHVWNGDSFIGGSGTRTTSGSFSFKATAKTMYWIWDMQCVANNEDYNYKVNATIELNQSASATTLALRPAEIPQISLNWDGIDDTNMDTWYPVNEQYPMVGDSYEMAFEPAEGCAMAEIITVVIDGVAYTVYTDGRAAEGLAPTYDPAANVLTIPAELLTAETALVSVTASAVPADIVIAPEPEQPGDPVEAAGGITLTKNLPNVGVQPVADFVSGGNYSLVLTPDEGYALPATIKVEISGGVYEVSTTGEHSAYSPIWPSFDPDTNTLTIPAALLCETEQGVTVAVSGETIALLPEEEGTGDGVEESDEEVDGE